MTTYGSLRSGDTATLPSTRRTPLLIGTCEIDPGATVTFDPGDDVTGTLGGGRLAEAVLFVHATTGRRVEARRATPTYGALPAVTHVGSGPAVTVALSSGSPGPLYPYTIKARVIVAGAGGAGQVALAYDGTTEVETLTIPEEPPAILRGSKDIRLGASVAGLTLVTSAPTADTITFSAGSLVAAAAGLKAATACLATTAQAFVSSDLLDAGEAALAAHPRRLTFLTAGVTASDAPATVTIVGTDPSGAAQTETALALAQTAASVTTAKAWKTITSITYSADGGTGATIAIGYADATADSAELVADFNALADATDLDVHARVYQASTGEEYFELYSLAGGVSVTLTLDLATSTGDTLLGLTTASATGSTAKTSLPFTGVDLVWPAGDYEADDTYTIPLPGPTATVQAVSDAATAGIADYLTHPFGRIVVVDPPATQTIARGMHDALTTLCAASIADPNTPAYIDFAAPTALHTASATRSTNRVNIATNDAAMIAAFASQAKSYVRNRVHGDAYIAGAPELRSGTFRQPATFAAAVKIAGAGKIAANPADGVVPGVSLLGPDQLTEARDDAAVTPHLGKLTASSGSWVLKSTSTSEVKFDVCATMAGPTSRLRSPGAVATGLEALRIIFEKVELWEGQTPETDPTTPKAIAPDEAEQRANDLHAALAEVLTPADPNTPSNVSGDFTVRVTAPLLADDGAAIVSVAYNPLAEIGLVNVVVTATAAKLATAA